MQAFSDVQLAAWIKAKRAQENATDFAHTNTSDILNATAASTFVDDDAYVPL